MAPLVAAEVITALGGVNPSVCVIALHGATPGDGQALLAALPPSFRRRCVGSFTYSPTNLSPSLSVVGVAASDGSTAVPFYTESARLPSSLDYKELLR